MDRLEKLEKKTSTHDLTLDDCYNQLKVLKGYLDSSNERIGNIEGYIDRALPLQVNMSISDYLSEFLSVPDRLQLIEVDNRKMKELYDYIDDKRPE